MPKRVFEQVKWFFADEAENIIAETIKGINEEEQAIDELSLKVPQGRYILGYEHSDGARLMFKCSRQIVQGYGYQQQGDDCLDNRPDDKQSIKYWSNEVGDLLNPACVELDPEEAVISWHELPRELQQAYYNLWTNSCSSYWQNTYYNLWTDNCSTHCYLVEYAGRYGIALVNDYNGLDEEGKIEDREQETMKLLEDNEIPYLEVRPDEEDRKLIVILPWDISREDFEKVTNFLSKTAYEKDMDSCDEIEEER